jgi:hypothetical protein
VVVTKVFEINAIKDLRERKFSVGDDIHTIFFKYEICNIDDSGTIVNSVSVYIDFTTGRHCHDCLSLISPESQEETLQMVAARRKE